MSLSERWKKGEGSGESLRQIRSRHARELLEITANTLMKPILDGAIQQLNPEGKLLDIRNNIWGIGELSISESVVGRTIPVDATDRLSLYAANEIYRADPGEYIALPGIQDFKFKKEKYLYGKNYIVVPEINTHFLLGAEWPVYIPEHQGRERGSDGEYESTTIPATIANRKVALSISLYSSISKVDSSKGTIFLPSVSWQIKGEGIRVTRTEGVTVRELDDELLKAHGDPEKWIGFGVQKENAEVELVKQIREEGFIPRGKYAEYLLNVVSKQS